jgi:hypothetical protein
MTACAATAGTGGEFWVTCRYDTGHPLPHHDPACHWDWHTDPDGQLVRDADRTPYLCSMARMGAAYDGRAELRGGGQPACGICGTKAAGFNPGERWGPKE